MCWARNSSICASTVGVPTLAGTMTLVDVRPSVFSAAAETSPRYNFRGNLIL